MLWQKSVLGREFHWVKWGSRVPFLAPRRLQHHPSMCCCAGVRLPAETPVSVQGTGESVGLVRSCVGGTGLAVLKLQPALQAAAGKVQLVAGPAGGAQVKVMPFKPSWWSPEWGNEEGQQ